MTLETEQLYKLGHFAPEEQKYEYPDIWTIEKTTGPERLVLGVATNQIDCLLKLTNAMPEPFWLLYVLTVSRSGRLTGRYQSASPKTRDQVAEFLINFRSFLETDGRHSLWIGSEPGPELLVYEPHNKIYGYGPIEKFSSILSGEGLTLSPEITVPSPHSHHYHQAFDTEEDALMSHWEWLRFPLQESDDE